MSAGHTIIIAGGDGTINCVVNALRDSLADYRFGVIPMGTGNDFARTLGMPSDPVEAAAAIASGREVEVDVGRAIGTDVDMLFVNACMGGFPIDVDKAIEGGIKKRFGPLAFWIGGVKAASDFSKFEVSHSGSSVGECVAVGVGNGRTAGGGIEVWPQADPGDGALDLCAVQAKNFLHGLQTAMKARSGKHADLPEVHFSRKSEFHVTCEPPIEFNVDGEIVGLKTPARFLVSEKIRVRVPAP